MKINEIFPEIGLIKNADLRDLTVKVIEDAMKMGGWNPEDLENVPFTLLIENTKISIVTHIRAVTNTALKMGETLNRFYGDGFVDLDIIVCGGLLHDIGKLLEYRKENGKYIVSENGKFLRHPFSGAALSFKHSLPDAVTHIIAMHAKEGDLSKRTREAIIIHYADFSNFEPLKV
ncbi:MAG: HD domain-containing protein [bacterium]